MNYTIPLDQSTGCSVDIKLFRNVQNVPDLRQKIVCGELQGCIVKPSLIADVFQIVVAANKAAIAQKLTTKTIYTELLFNLSISKNITHSLQKFGIDNKETDVLAVVINNNTETDNANELFGAINGEEVNINELHLFSDLPAIKKAYKISDAEIKKMALIDSIVSRIAAKDIMSI